MAFGIRFLSGPLVPPETEERSAYGLITLGAFKERFISSLEYWDIGQYELHWKRAILRILQLESASCLITSLTDPRTANFIVWWPMYRIEEQVYVQNQILFLESLSKAFNENDPFGHLGPRKSVNADGEKLSEWSVPIKEVESFLRAIGSEG
jgi:hypothetical protein